MFFRIAPIAAALLLALGVSAAVAAKSHPIRVSPSPLPLRDDLTLSWRAPYGTDNPSDGYRIRFSGPGGVHCNVKTTYTAALTWGSQDNSRFVRHRVQVQVGSRRENNPPPQANIAWCPGKYSGRVVFRDLPFGKTAPIVYRYVGKFAFRAG